MITIPTTLLVLNLYLIEKKPLLEGAFLVEIRAGIEPAYAVLQTALWAARVPDQKISKIVGGDGIEPSTPYL